MNTRTSITSVRVLIVGLLVMASSMLGVATASAHAAAMGSNPENGAQIATAPDHVSVTFNEPMQESFASLTVVGPDGNLWTKSDPSVAGDTVSAELGQLGPAGEYTIAYRVVSADGHPVSGTSTFTLTQAESGAPGAPANLASDTSTSASSPVESGNGGVPLWPFIVAGVIVFAGGLWLALRKPRAES
ncbi:copper resistance protein CopC [Rhodococcus sp. WMMA185]|uniref:copper resistance CopC family protein n=1 Tax=Rhodococcus sp. WMMA185 TaxID=679318 RepID=UPI00087916F9|nr:copper resistance CopC family protein [Rhodococcus sp. WMMA185]AOW93838.1 copper resistance protein CopC [Rhodococcus sp. WMMA185]